ncbi:hypothetical protein FKW77_009556 [Venturia effusa]|uniref:Uncharacterized protein n=1 Tax=Venturia effusa TaxID=50376 RepID=A0A517LD04_9PEZI|nr:hypothetical protein FKW77_009556 [Venturia effusa]
MNDAAKNNDKLSTERISVDPDWPRPAKSSSPKHTLHDDDVDTRKHGPDPERVNLGGFGTSKLSAKNGRETTCRQIDQGQRVQPSKGFGERRSPTLPSTKTTLTSAQGDDDWPLTAALGDGQPESGIDPIVTAPGDVSGNGEDDSTDENAAVDSFDDPFRKFVTVIEWRDPEGWMAEQAIVLPRPKKRPVSAWLVDSGIASADAPPRVKTAGDTSSALEPRTTRTSLRGVCDDGEQLELPLTKLEWLEEGVKCEVEKIAFAQQCINDSLQTDFYADFIPS